ncbi:DUF1566 domain-containing protein [Granulosicoccaceae sp. 1_MG-2023]|nr:DUF1566 domain-containing protein [Granulosicoccaceae sp. 1_MG-2023]
MNHSQRTAVQANGLRGAAILALLCLGLTMSLPAPAACRPDLYQTAAPERFETLDDDIIVDNVTGLMWQRCLLGLSGQDCATGQAEFLSWPDALQAATDDRTGGYSDWRLPNIKELASLVEYACTGPAMDEDQFPNTGIQRSDGDDISFIVWSATPYYDSALIRYLDFSNAADNALARDSEQLVRLVRDL